jgi:phosphatidylglycerophosphatase A
MRHLITMLATGCYICYTPKAPGTAGSILGLCIIWSLADTSSLLYIILTIFLLILGIWVSGRAEIYFGHDGSQIVIDEIIGVMITFVWIPLTVHTLIIGFILFRIMDIVKPFPADRAQKLPGGIGVVADDVIAAVYAHLLLQGILIIMERGAL